MAIPSEFIENIKEIPCCLYCGNEMTEHHSKMWAGCNYHYLSIEFRCNGNEGTAPHHMSIRARTIAEWESHKAILNLKEGLNNGKDI